MTTRLGLTFPLFPFDVRRSCELAKEAESLGYTDGWTAETAGPDGLAVATALGVSTETMRIGCAVVPAYSRPPALIAMGALAAHQASSGRFCLGIGSSSPVIVDRWMGIPFEQPYLKVKETLRATRAALSGEKVKFAGETLRVDGFKLDVAADVPIYLAALGPQMMNLAAKEADGIALFLATEEGVRIARRAAGDAEVVERIICVPDVPVEDVRGMARWMLAPYLAVPAYNNFLAAQGFEGQAKDIINRWTSGDRNGALEALSDEVIDALVLMGPSAACKERLDSFREAGLDTPILMIVAPQGEEGTLGAMRALAPSA
jgi:probable F420-dependent oxidoreductase